MMISKSRRHENSVQHVILFTERAGETCQILVFPSVIARDIIYDRIVRAGGLVKINQIKPESMRNEMIQLYSIAKYDSTDGVRTCFYVEEGNGSAQASSVQV